MITLFNQQSKYPDGLPIFETAPEAPFEVSIWQHFSGWAWEVEDSKHGYGGTEDEGLPTLDAAKASLIEFLEQPIEIKGE